VTTWKKPIKCVVYKLFCESHYELLNFATNLRTSQRSSEHLWPKFREIDCNMDQCWSYSTIHMLWFVSEPSRIDLRHLVLVRFLMLFIKYTSL
jgi:hypothetical protein